MPFGCSHRPPAVPMASSPAAAAAKHGSGGIGRTWCRLQRITKACFHPLSGNWCGVQRTNHKFILFSKRSVYQEFDSFVKPSRLLPTSQVDIYAGYVPEEVLLTLKLDDSDSCYMVELRTGRDFSSSLVDMNDAILLCIVNSEGDAILQRIPSVSVEQSGLLKESENLNSIHFQRGSVDFVVFKGAKLKNILALWIGLESGSWTLEALQLTVIHGPLSFPQFIKDASDQQLFDCVQYKFEEKSICLGERGQSVVELRPLISMELPGISISSLVNNKKSSQFNQLSSSEELMADGMKEYADLKFSLLFYDAAVVLTGSTVLLFSSNEKAGYSYLIGGIAGFLYLLLLQRSVDGLTLDGFPLDDTNKETLLRRSEIRNPLLILAAGLAMTAVAVKIWSGESIIELTPEELFLGTAGFLTSKLAVVLAAFKPLRRSSRDN